MVLVSWRIKTSGFLSPRTPDLAIFPGRKLGSDQSERFPFQLDLVWVKARGRLPGFEVLGGAFPR
eukprot:5020472-Heterocapsa_arctica.AAC.1